MILSCRLFALALAVLWLTGCTRGPDALRVAAAGDLATLDPQAVRETFTTEFLANIMEPLVRYGRDMQPEPALAERWERISEDRWRFFLRRGVRFSNGSPFAADDVAFTFVRGSHETSPLRGNIAGIATIEVIDDHTVDVVTRGPYPLVVRELTSMLIFDRDWVEEHDAGAPVDPVAGGDGYLSRHILGTGPYRLLQREPGLSTVLELNSDWWDQQRAEKLARRVEFFAIQSDATRVAALLAGQVDLLLSVPLQDLDRIRQTPGLQVLERSSLRTLSLGVNVGREPLSEANPAGPNPLADVRVRRALAHAIDTEAIISTVMRGHADPASAIMSADILGYDACLNERTPYDLAEARRLLTEAGYASGFSVRLDCPNDRFPKDGDTCLAIAGMLAKVGIRVRLQVQPKARYFQATLGGRPELWLLGYASADTMDAQGFLKDLVHTRIGNKGGFNVGEYSNPRIDELEPLIAREADGPGRAALICEAFGIHKADTAHIPLHTLRIVWAARDHVAAVQPANEGLWLRAIGLR